MKRVSHPGFQLSYARDQFEAKWQPYSLPKIAGRGIYVFGRDYDELLGSFELPPTFKNAKRLDPRSPSFNTVTSTKISSYKIHDALRFNRDAESILQDGKRLAKISQLSADTYISRFRDAYPDAIYLLSALRDSIDAITLGLGSGGGGTVLSLDALEGTTFLLALAHIVNHDSKQAPWVVFGPERYATAFNLSEFRRPYLNTDVVLSFFRESAGTSVPHAAERFDRWSEVRLESARDRTITLREANDFLRFAIAKASETEEELISQIVPKQTAAPLNVRVEYGRLARVELHAEFVSDEKSIEASSQHLLNLIDDICSAGNLSNWVPGAQRKLERIAGHLERVKDGSIRTVADVTQLALDGEALRSLYEKSKEELSDAVANEFSPFFLHLNLLLSQFPAWREFIDNAERMNWGRGVSSSYALALDEVFLRIDEAGGEVADEGVREYAKAVVANDAKSDEDIAGTASSARNILSEAVRFLMRQREAAMRGATKALSERTELVANSALKTFLNSIGEVLLRLAKENPTAFGWIEHAARILGIS
ncbi:hypothetical protein [Phenylobacterium hankyongense]|uniref:hypothetical protein n=1 Tax=Phenylobacterium hankyongense TaxID=1813876 RepID=UPI001057826B|nr:hypothetical protein [Phenylobacterium hankyongense]